MRQTNVLPYNVDCTTAWFDNGFHAPANTWMGHRLQSELASFADMVKVGPRATGRADDVEISSPRQTLQRIRLGTHGALDQFSANGAIF